MKYTVTRSVVFIAYNVLGKPLEYHITDRFEAVVPENLLEAFEAANDNEKIILYQSLNGNNNPVGFWLNEERYDDQIIRWEKVG